MCQFFKGKKVPTMQPLNAVCVVVASCSGQRAASPLVACGVFAACSFVVQLLENFSGAELSFGLPQLLQLLLLQVCGRDISGF